MRSAFVRTLVTLAAEDPAVWLVAGDLGYTVLEPFIERFPDRFLNAGVAEQSMIGLAAGLAVSGKKVWVYSIGNFATVRCLEQIRNDVCRHGAAVTVVAVGGGLAYGAQGFTHHALEDLAIMRAMPGMTVVAPTDPLEVELATNALARRGAPGYLRLAKAGEPVLLPGRTQFNFGGVSTLREGVDVRFLATGSIAAEALAAAELLGRGGTSAGAATLACLKPCDEHALAEFARSARLLCTVEEHGPHGGLGDLAGRTLASHGVTTRLLTLCVDEGKLDGGAGDRAALLHRAGLSAEAMARRVRSALDAGRV